jgi:hypothetical protein
VFIMDVFKPDGIVNSGMSVADKIRALATGGHSRADIARLLGKRYQHVRNVLEADKLPRGGSPARPAFDGVEEASSTFNGVHRLLVDSDGRVRLPAHVLAALGGPSGVLIGELEEDAFVILSARAAALRARKRVMSASRDPARVLSDELILERRAETAREDG